MFSPAPLTSFEFLFTYLTTKLVFILGRACDARSEIASTAPPHVTLLVGFWTCILESEFEINRSFNLRFQIWVRNATPSLVTPRRILDGNHWEPTMHNHILKTANIPRRRRQMDRETLIRRSVPEPPTVVLAGPTKPGKELGHDASLTSSCCEPAQAPRL